MTSGALGHFTTVSSKRAGRLLVVAAMVLTIIQLGSGRASAVQFCNTTAVVGTTGTGPASPYPSSINVSGLIGTVTDVNVFLLDFTTLGDTNSPPQHWAEDQDIMVAAPSVSNVILMSDAGGDNDMTSGPVTAADLNFDDQAANQLPADFLITSGTWRPVNDDDPSGQPPRRTRPTVAGARADAVRVHVARHLQRHQPQRHLEPLGHRRHE